MNEEQERAVRGLWRRRCVLDSRATGDREDHRHLQNHPIKPRKAGNVCCWQVNPTLQLTMLWSRFANANIRPIRRYAQSAEVDPEAEEIPRPKKRSSKISSFPLFGNIVR